MKAMGGYHGLYLKTDVLLLGDAFENIINTCLEYYGLDPFHHFRSPRLCWDVMLIMTEIKLELISDILGMYSFIEKRMRGGISCIPKIFSKANNKYMQSDDKSKPSKYIMHLNSNNLYGWAMSQYLPYSKFKWLS